KRSLCRVGGSPERIGLVEALDAPNSWRSGPYHVPNSPRNGPEVVRCNQLNAGLVQGVFDLRLHGHPACPRPLSYTRSGTDAALSRSDRPALASSWVAASAGRKAVMAVLFPSTTPSPQAPIRHSQNLRRL